MTKKERTKQFGLVGKNIDYSFSRTYFKNKFDSENKVGYSYVNFDLQSIDNIKEKLIILNVSDEELKIMDKTIRDKVASAVEFAQQSEEPDPKELYTDVLI